MVTIRRLRERDGRERGCLALLTDITERRRRDQEGVRLELQFRQAQGHLLLGNLAGAIARDFNQNLRQIATHAEHGLALLPEGELARCDFSEIRSASDRALDLVQRLLALSRWQEPHRQRLPLDAVVQDALHLLGRTLSPGVQLQSRLAGGTPPVEIDPGQIHQAVVDLGLMAARAMEPGGGLLEVRLDALTLTAQVQDAPLAATAGLSEGSYLRLSVSASHGGTDPAEVRRLFEPCFARGVADREPGLGLSVAKAIIESHGAVLRVESQHGRGTTFRIFFPVAAPVAVDHRASASGAAPAGQALRRGGHVMCVDDDEVIVYITTRALERLGYQATGFLDATAALEAFRARPDDYDAIVTDLSMPGMTGPELALEVRQIRPAMPLLLTSGCIRPEDIATAQNLGLSDLVPKPCSVEELGSVLQRLLLNRQARG
jgi:signal transduction histidine kinase/ActR/RegA family two-component response regulator